MPNESTINIFAYGSNLHLNRMKARVPSAVPLEIGFVEQRKIVFHKRSVDGSSKANAAATSKSDDQIWGVIYQIDVMEKPVLDKHESLGIGYDEEHIEVGLRNGGCRQALMYVARRESIDDSLKPYSWYVDFVVQGACQHRLPLCYISNHLRVQSTIDPILARQQENGRVLLR